MLADVYVLTSRRSAEVVRRFVDHFLPQRESADADYPVPQYSDSPEFILKTADEVIDYCELHPDAAQSVYWRNPDSCGELHSAHVFFLSDGGLVLGLSIHEKLGDELLARLLTFSGSRIGYVTHEEPPPLTSSEFMQIASSRRVCHDSHPPAPDKLAP